MAKKQKKGKKQKQNFSQRNKGDSFNTETASEFALETGTAEKKDSLPCCSPSEKFFNPKENKEK